MKMLEGLLKVEIISLSDVEIFKPATNETDKKKVLNVLILDNLV